MRPDSSAIVNAVIAKLGADPVLLALVPNGVYEDLAPPNAQRFVVVSQMLAMDTAVMHQGRVIEDALLLVEARVLKSSGGDVGAAAAAAARIDTLLEDQALSVPLYRVTACYREEFVRGTEVDEIDPSIVWKRRGGRYRVRVYRELMASAVAAVSFYPSSAEQFGKLDVGIWFDGPLMVHHTPGDPWPAVYLEAVSSDLAVSPNWLLSLNPDISDYNVTDPTAPGRAVIRFVFATDMQAWAGVTFTCSNASQRVNWDLILNAETGEPVVDSLGDLVLTIPIQP